MVVFVLTAPTGPSSQGILLNLILDLILATHCSMVLLIILILVFQDYLPLIARRHLARCYFTSVTGTRESLTTRAATEPSKRLPRLPRPRVPITI